MREAPSRCRSARLNGRTGTEKTKMDGVSPASFPPSPWFLGGDLLVSVWLPRPESLPDALAPALPAGWRPVVLAGRAVVGTAFVHYLPGGVLAYEELLVAVLVRRGARLRVCLPQIWVTSEASRRGGRVLWGIPKHLADLRRLVRPVGRVASAMHVGERAVVSLEAEVGARLLPGSLTLPLPTVQRLDGVTTLATNTVTTGVRSLRARWTFSPEGPLRHLAGRRPVLSLALVPAAITFGRDVERS